MGDLNPSHSGRPFAKAYVITLRFTSDTTPMCQSLPIKRCGGRVVDTTLPLATGLAQYSYPFIRAILLNLSEFLSYEIQGYRISTYQRRMPCDLGSLVALERCGPHVIGAGRWGRTTRVIDSRFTVCPASIYGISQHIKLLGCAITPKESAIIHKAPYIGRLICVAYDGLFAAGALPLFS